MNLSHFLECIGGRLRLVSYAILGRVFILDWVLLLVHRITGTFCKQSCRFKKWPSLLLSEHKNTRFQILIYHRVTAQSGGFLDGMLPSVFFAQMEYLAKFTTVLPLSEVVGHLEARESLPPWTVVITFDDGYRDNYENAFPILKKFGLSATFFLASDFIGTGKIIWHDQVFSSFNTASCPSFYLPEVNRHFDLKNDQSRREAEFLTRTILRRLSETDREKRVKDLQQDLGATVIASKPDLMLQWEHVREMAKENMSFGSHSVTHPILTMLPHFRVFEELTLSKKKIEDELGSPVDFFAYPNGMERDFNQRIQEMAQDAGYRAALTTVYGVNDIETPRFALRRYTPWESDIGRFALKLNWSRLVG